MEFRGRVGDWITEVRQARERREIVLFVAETHGRAERTIEILQEYEIVADAQSTTAPRKRSPRRSSSRVGCALRAVSDFPELADAALQIYAETDVFEEERHAPEKRRNLAKTFLSDLRDLKVGDLVVHVDHGIGEFVGLKQISPIGRPLTGPQADLQEFLEASLSTARTSCSFPSSVSIWSRSTPAGAVPRSIALAARRGRKPRRASRRRCATWRRNC